MHNCPNDFGHNPNHAPRDHNVHTFIGEPEFTLAGRGTRRTKNNGRVGMVVYFKDFWGVLLFEMCACVGVLLVCLCVREWCVVGGVTRPTFS